METIKFSRTAQVILIIVIVLIIVLAITSSKSKRQDESGQKRLLILSEQWKELMKQIDDEIKSLQLTQKMQRKLEREVKMYMRFAIGVVSIVFLFFVTYFFRSGIDITTSIINTAGLFSFTFFGGSLWIVLKFVDPNTAIAAFGNWVRKKVYEKNNFDPFEAELIQKSLAVKQQEANEIRKELTSSKYELTPA